MGHVRTRAGSSDLRHLARIGQRPDRLPLYGRDPRGRRRWPRVALTATAVVMVPLLGFGAVVALQDTTVTLDGIEDGQVLNRPQSKSLQVAVDAAGFGVGDPVVALDGRPLSTRALEDGRLVADVPELTEGTHTLTASVGSWVPTRSADVEKTFTVKLEGPSLRAQDRFVITDPEADVVIRGMAIGAQRVLVGETDVAVSGGKFEAAMPPTPGPLTIRAYDAQGFPDSVTVDVITPEQLAADPPAMKHEGFRAVHIRAEDWADPARRQAVLDMGRQGLIDAVQLDIKDEYGMVGYDTGVAMAHEIGAVAAHYDARQAIDEIHSSGLKAVGRIVNFLDPALGKWAWENGHPDYLVLDPTGTTPYNSKYGRIAFTNPSNPVVQQYQIDLATEAAQLGFDDILYDYVRRPDGPIDKMSFPGNTLSPEVFVADFVRKTHDALAPHDTGLGLSLFGVAATRPTQIAQDMQLMLPYVDFISPMLYPSLWNPGEYNVASPTRQPYDIVSRSMADFNEVALASGVPMIPWLQAWNPPGMRYGPGEVDAQIQAAYDQGANGFLLWNAVSKYQPEGMAPSLSR